jgi:hypothetical protein
MEKGGKEEQVGGKYNCRLVPWRWLACTVLYIAFAATSVEAVSSGWILGIYQQLPDSHKSALVL